MTESTCQETGPRLAGLIDGLLPTAEAIAARAHLAECQACRATYARYARHAAAIERALETAPWLPVSDHVRARLSGRARRPWLGRLWSSTRALGHGLQMAVLLLLVAGGFALLLRSGPGRDLGTVWREGLERPLAPPAATAPPQPPASRSVLPSTLALANGSLDPAVPGGLVAFEIPSGRTLGRYADIRRQGGGLAVAPDGWRAYLLDGPFFHELEFPSLRELRTADLPDAINIMGTGGVVAVSADGGSVYVETWRVTGPPRIDRQLGAGEPDGDYGIAVYDVAKGAFVRELTLEPPWCGIATLDALPDGRLELFCATAHDVRLLDPTARGQLASVGVDAIDGIASRDGNRLFAVDAVGGLHEVSLGKLAETRKVDLYPDRGGLWVPIRPMHLSADGTRLFVRAAPGRRDLRATGQASVVWVVNTTTLQKVAEVPLPFPAFDAAPTPDGQTLLVSNTNTQDPNARMTRLLEVPSGHELARWAGSIVGIQFAALSGVPRAPAPAPTAASGDTSSPDRLPTRAPAPTTPLVAAPHDPPTSSTPTPTRDPLPMLAAAQVSAEARATFERFMEARLLRQGPAAVDLLTDDLRGTDQSGVGQLIPASNPCWYRYEVLSFERPLPTAATARVRVYTHWWPGDVAGGPPRSWEQEVGLVQTPTGWRIDRLSETHNTRDEPGEPHGPTTSACNEARPNTPVGGPPEGNGRTRPNASGPGATIVAGSQTGFTFVSGQLRRVSAHSLLIELPGAHPDSVTVLLGPATQICRRSCQAAWGDLQIGDRVSAGLESGPGAQPVARWVNANGLSGYGEVKAITGHLVTIVLTRGFPGSERDLAVESSTVINAASGTFVGEVGPLRVGDEIYFTGTANNPDPHTRHVWALRIFQLQKSASPVAPAGPGLL